MKFKLGDQVQLIPCEYNQRLYRHIGQQFTVKIITAPLFKGGKYLLTVRNNRTGQYNEWVEDRFQTINQARDWFQEQARLV